MYYKAMVKTTAKKSSQRKGKTTRVNIAGPLYKDKAGHLWAKDKAYHKGSWGCLNMPATDILETNDPIENTRDAKLFRTVRTAEEMYYRFDLPNGKYQIRILFAEIYWESGDAEQQAVHVQGKKVLNHFNIFDQAGHDTALEKSFAAKVTKKFLEVRFIGLSLPMHTGARACGIEVKSL